jgi:hypothetical protein
VRRPSRKGLSPYATMALALPVAACFMKPTEQIILSPPRPSAPPDVIEERREAEPELTATVSNAEIDVTLTHPIECRHVTVTPMVQDNEARQSAPRKIQAGNIVGATVFLGVGTIAIPNAVPVQVGIGISFLAIGTLFASAFISNAVRPHDTKETIPVHPQRAETAFQTCETPPMTDARVVAAIGGTTLRAVTGPDGHATFNLSSLQPTPELLRSPIAHVQRDRYGTKPIDVDLTPSSLFPKWQAAVDEAARRQQEEQDRHKPSPRTR